MPASVVLGAQWGDEGKGKAIDQLAPNSQWAVRFQGGNNAGHTIVAGGTTLKMHLLPSGITARDCNLVLGCGMVVDPWVLDRELSEWAELTGESPEGRRLFISERAAVILPFHRLYDSADELVGTTGRGIGPAYRDRTERVGLRFVDIGLILGRDSEIAEISERMNDQLSTVGVGERIDPEQLKSELSWVHERFSDAIRATGPMLDKALARGEQVLLEGAQGAMLDIDQGTYPFVTSSITCRANATHGAGIHPGHIDQCYGITKAYTTRVGNGPFPTELSLEEGPGRADVSGRSRVRNHHGASQKDRMAGCGCPQREPAAQRIHGTRRHQAGRTRGIGRTEDLHIVQSGWEEIDHVPSSSEELARCTPVYESHPGFPALDEDEWIGMAEESRKGGGIDSLPSPIRSYLSRIEEITGVPVVSVGVGPDRLASVASAGGPFDVEMSEATF